MTTSTRKPELDLAEAVALARRPAVAPAMPRAALPVVLKTSPLLRRALPTPLAVRLAERAGASIWEQDRKAREDGMAMARAILGGTAREGEERELARRHLIEDRVQKALFWQPWPMNEITDASAANLSEAMECGRPLIVSACHVGPFFRQISVVAGRAVAQGRAVHTVSAPWYFEPPTPDAWGRRLALWWQRMAARGERAVLSVGSFPVLVELLRGNQIVMIFFDMPGGTRTTFLGKPVMLSSGTARLAFESEALIVPLRARRDGSRVWTDVFAPLDPHRFAGPTELHEALAAVHERSILELPWTLEDPNRAGAWEGGADAREWARPA